MKKLLNYSIKHDLKHIPSALSQYSYLKTVLPMLRDYKIVIGKPFGAQAYYCIWDEMYQLPEKLGYGIKHAELDFIEYGEETLGNALGVASGISLAQNDPVWCNVSDGCLQMGATLEAIQFIGKHKQNILLTIDFNGVQLTGNTQDIMGINMFNIEAMFRIYGWETQICDTRCINDLGIKMVTEQAMESDKPFALIFKTSKGQGVKEMEEDPVGWHYKSLKDINEINIIKND